MILRPARAGLTLLEVVISMLILLLSLGAIGVLVRMGSDRALDVQQQSRASMLCQAKLSEIMVGAEPLSSTGYTPFKEDADWLYRVEATQHEASGLWSVQVWAKHERADGRVVEAQLGQLLLDPSIRGSTLDRPPETLDDSMIPDAPMTDSDSAQPEPESPTPAAAPKTPSKGPTTNKGPTTAPGRGPTPGRTAPTTGNPSPTGPRGGTGSKGGR